MMPWRRGWSALVVGVACLATLAAALGVVATDATGDRAPAGAGRRTPVDATAGSATQRSSPRVASLNRVVTPDLLIVSRRTIAAAAARKVERTTGVTEVLRVAAGEAQLGSDRVSLLGVNPSTFRAWTPLASAKSDELWQALAHDQLVLTFAARKVGQVRLGKTYPVASERMLSLRLGGVAELQLPHVDGLVTSTTARGLGLTGGAGMLVNAPATDMAVLKRKVRRTVGRDARIVPMRAPHRQAGRTGQQDDDSGETGTARSYRELYQQSANRCPGLSWAVLAAIGQVESGHGRNMGPSSAGALGPMQFLPSTWSSYGVDGNGDGKRDVWDPYDAVPAAADYLCAHGGGKSGRSLYQAIYAYNHADSYVREVLATAEVYARS